MAKPKTAPYLCCIATSLHHHRKGKPMNALRNGTLSERLGLIFSTVLVAVLPVAAVVAVIQAL